MRKGLPCRYCHSSAWRNPCWWKLVCPDSVPRGEEPPCISDDFATADARRRRRASRNALLIALAIIAAIILAAVHSRAHAQGTSNERAACTSDAFRLCAVYALTLNARGVIKCLIANKQNLSKPCRDVLAAHHAN